MKHGVRIPKEKRAAMAERALCIFEGSVSRAFALTTIEDEFDVSSPTARNLINYGRYLRKGAQPCPPLSSTFSS
jgi:hypothetical protein